MDKVLGKLIKFYNKYYNPELIAAKEAESNRAANDISIKKKSKRDRSFVNRTTAPLVL